MDETVEPVWFNYLKLVRSEGGYSQSDVASAIQVAQTTVAAIENGKLSGRKYMDQIASFLGVGPENIFPYYCFITLKEAEQEYGVSPTKIDVAITKGRIRTIETGRLKLLHKDDLSDPRLLKRSGPSMREVVSEYLQHRNGSGATTDELLNLFEGDDKVKQKRSLQSILSRSKEFSSFKNGDHYVWKYQTTGTS